MKLHHGGRQQSSLSFVFAVSSHIFTQSLFRWGGTAGAPFPKILAPTSRCYISVPYNPPRLQVRVRPIFLRGLVCEYSDTAGRAMYVKTVIQQAITSPSWYSPPRLQVYPKLKRIVCRGVLLIYISLFIKPTMCAQDEGTVVRNACQITEPRCEYSCR